MIKVGITGGIGSGKSTVCKIFECLGAPIYYADDRAKELMHSSVKLKVEITKLLGEQAYLRNGELNRNFIADEIFKNDALRLKLNQIVHPFVIKDGQKWQKQHANCKYTIKEAALLVQSGSYKYLDKLIVVTAPESLRIQRILKRNPNMTIDDIKRRLSAQMKEDELVKYADWVITNDGTKSIISQVYEIHQSLLHESERNIPR